MQRIEEEVRFYQEKFPGLKDLLEFYLAVFQLQSRCLAQTKQVPVWDKKAVPKRLEKLRPALHSDDIPVDAELFRNILKDLCQLAGSQSRRKIRLDRFLSDSELGPDRIDDFLARVKRNDVTYLEGLTNRSKASRELIYFVVQNSLAPFYQKAAGTVSSYLDLSSWSAGFCPVCGRLPLGAVWSGEGGLKVLECLLCGMQWEHSLNQCPFCDNDKVDKLLYFSSEEDKGHGILACQQCNKYLKISNQKELEREVVIAVEQVATAYLNQYAEKEGYQRGGEYVEKVD